MAETRHYDSFPIWMAILSAFDALLVYVIGVYVLIQFGIVLAVIYIVYCLWVEFRVFKKSCVNCFYYGKVCGLGRGILCPFLFKKGDPQKFVEKDISWIHILPDFLVSIVPLLCGIILLIKNFSWLLVLLLIILFILSFAGTALIRGSYACKYCKQKQLGCPAEKLFSKQTPQNT